MEAMTITCIAIQKVQSSINLQNVRTDNYSYVVSSSSSMKFNTVVQLMQQLLKCGTCRYVNGEGSHFLASTVPSNAQFQ